MERHLSQYGLVDAFNPLKKWYDTDVVGIDVGITMVSSRTPAMDLWDTFKEKSQRSAE